MRLTTPLAAVVCALALGGCFSTTPHATPGTVWTLHYDAVQPVPLATNVGPVVLSGTTAIFPFTDRHQGSPDALGSLSLRTGKRRVLARSQFPGGSILGAVRAGSDVVYVEESSRGLESPGSAQWRVIALRAHRVLASSGNRKDTMSPDLTAIDGAAVWTVYSEHGGGVGHAFGWKPGGRVAPRDALPGDEVECTPPTTNLEGIAACSHRGPWIAWVEMTAEGTSEQLFYARDNAGGSHRIANLNEETSGPVVLGDYLLWDSGTGLEVTSLVHPSATVEVLVPGPDDEVYVYGTGSDQTAIVVTVEHDTTKLRVIDTSRLRLSSSTR